MILRLLVNRAEKLHCQDNSLSFYLLVICIDFCPHLFAQRRYPARLARSFWHTFCGFIGCWSLFGTTLNGRLTAHIRHSNLCCTTNITSTQQTNRQPFSFYQPSAFHFLLRFQFHFKFHLSVIPFMKYSNPRHSFSLHSDLCE